MLRAALNFGDYCLVPDMSRKVILFICSGALQHINDILKHSKKIIMRQGVRTSCMTLLNQHLALAKNTIDAYSWNGRLHRGIVARLNYLVEVLSAEKAKT